MTASRTRDDNEIESTLGLPEPLARRLNNLAEKCKIPVREIVISALEASFQPSSQLADHRKTREIIISALEASMIHDGGYLFRLAKRQDHLEFERFMKDNPEEDCCKDVKRVEKSGRRGREQE